MATQTRLLVIEIDMCTTMISMLKLACPRYVQFLRLFRTEIPISDRNRTKKAVKKVFELHFQ